MPVAVTIDLHASVSGRRRMTAAASCLARLAHSVLQRDCIPKAEHLKRRDGAGPEIQRETSARPDAGSRWFGCLSAAPSTEGGRVKPSGTNRTELAEAPASVCRRLAPQNRLGGCTTLPAQLASRPWAND